MKPRRYSKHHVLPVSRAAALVLCLVFGLSGLAQVKPKSSAPNAEKQKAAEAAADRVMARFYDRLDFSVIYREMYGSDQLKHREVESSIGNLLLDLETLRLPPLIQFAAMERALIAKRNFDFLVSAMNFTGEGDREIFKNELELNIKRYYMPTISPANWPILTSAQLDSVFTANFDHLNEFLRKHVFSKNYNTDLYRKRVAAFEESRPLETDFIQSMTKLKVFIVQRERLHLYFVEEDGQFKLLSMTPRVQD